MSLAAIEARARAKAASADPKARARRYAATQKAARLANLKAEGFVIPLSEWLGHNNGPLFEVSDLFLEWCWRKAHEKAWAAPTLEIGIRRARKAQSLGLTYREYVLEIIERGRHLDAVGAEEAVNNRRSHAA